VECTRVLVADDNGRYRSLLSRFVSSQPDMEVVGLATDGDEAVRLASQLLPDVVLMDLCMPGIGGIEATRVLANTHREIRVVALTAHQSDDSESRSVEAGAAAFLRKTDVDVRLLDLVRSFRAYGQDDRGA
jgi:two-component system nitrate/nitrite response regulator NarL